MPISRPPYATLSRRALMVLALVAAAPAGAQAPQPERPLAALSFMAGCWRGDAGVDRIIEEQWTAADSDVMLSTTRYLDNTGGTHGWEFSRILADSAGIVLVPAPMGTAQGRFRLTPGQPGEARFEDPSHDYPRRIIYRRVDARTLVVQLDGGEGSEEGVELRLQSVPCPAPSSR